MIDAGVISTNARTFPSRRELNPDIRSERQVQQARLPPRLPTATSTVSLTSLSLFPCSGSHRTPLHHISISRPPSRCLLRAILIPRLKGQRSATFPFPALSEVTGAALLT